VKIKTVKTFFISIVLVIILFVLGFGSRLFIFITLQKKLFERNILDKELVESKQGGNTPQETWNLYLDALEKEDIETAVSYWWPSERERMQTTLKKLKDAGLLKRYAANHGRELREKQADSPLEKDEKLYSTSYLNEKSISLLLSEVSLAIDFLRKSNEIYWQKLGRDKEQTKTGIIFKLNSYSKKWLIKE
jgi:hypothetical protein